MSETQTLRAEVEALRHDIERHQKIAAELATENEKLREAAETVAFHYFNCEGQCGKLRQAVAQLAKASGYSDRAVNDEIDAALGDANG